MIPTITRVGMLVMAAFTTSMLLGSSLIWATTQASVPLGEHVKTVALWTLLAGTYYLWAILLDYVDHGSLARAVRGGSVITACTGALVVVALAMWYGSSAAGLFGA